MLPVAPRGYQTLRLLTRVADGHRLTQRSLAKELGIALGLTNLLIHRLAKKGWVEVVNIRGNQVRHLITPEGMAEKTRITLQYLDTTVRL